MSNFVDMERLFETKDNAGEIKDLDTKNRKVVAVFANWNLDHHNDVIEKGSFAKTLMERQDKILFLNQHNWKQPHGFFESLSENSEGLVGVSKALPDTTFSNDAIKLYEAGIVKEHSIGFEVIKSDWDEDSQVRTIKEIKLWEGSNVTLGANSATPFLGLKAKTLPEINDLSAKIIKAIRHGTFTDETFLQLEIALKQLTAEAIKLGEQKVLNQPDPETTDPSDALAEINKFILKL